MKYENPTSSASKFMAGSVLEKGVKPQGQGGYFNLSSKKDKIAHRQQLYVKSNNRYLTILCRSKVTVKVTFS